MHIHYLKTSGAWELTERSVLYSISLCCAIMSTMFSGIIVLASLILTSAQEVRSFHGEAGQQFKIDARVIQPYTSAKQIWVVEGDDGKPIFLYAYSMTPKPPEAGDLIELSGYITDGIISKNFKIKGKGPKPIPAVITANDIRRPELNYQLVSAKASVQDVFHDEIDPPWYFISLDLGDAQVFATLASKTNITANLRKLVGAEVEATGILHEALGSRYLTGRRIALNSIDDLNIIRPASEDPFDIPEIGNPRNLGPQEISAIGRRRITGSVIAVWNGNRVLLQPGHGQLSRIELADTTVLPAYGDTIDAVGFVETDLYRINFSRAIWRKSSSTNELASAKPSDVSARDILMDKTGGQHIFPRYHGQLISLKGIVSCPPNADRGIYTLMSDGLEVKIDASALVNRSADLAANQGTGDMQIANGTKIQIAGTAILESDNWMPHVAFPRITGLKIVPRTPADIVILATPSWWTTKRLLTVIGILFSVLVAILIWNWMLNRLVERRTRQYLHERSAKDAAKLKAEERMRLAVELHDSLSQDLAGIALKIDSAETAAENGTSPLPFLKATRLRMMNCRKNLRDCLWDLRSRAFDCKTLEEAIRMTLAPHLGDAELTIDSSVRRSDISDNSIHPILCILRELTVNAIRHGHATRITISVSPDNTNSTQPTLTPQRSPLNSQPSTLSTLAITFTDNGCGFDMATRPGPAEGHFGLQGVTERVEHLEGSLAIDSAPGRGTVIRITSLNIS